MVQIWMLSPAKTHTHTQMKMLATLARKMKKDYERVKSA
jgi:hypothetical protein